MPGVAAGIAKHAVQLFDDVGDLPGDAADGFALEQQMHQRESSALDPPANTWRIASSRNCLSSNSSMICQPVGNPSSSVKLPASCTKKLSNVPIRRRCRSPSSFLSSRWQSAGVSFRDGGGQLGPGTRVEHGGGQPNEHPGQDFSGPLRANVEASTCSGGCPSAANCK